MSLFCSKCGELDLKLNVHACPPAWEVIFPDRGHEWEDAMIVHAHTPSGAAEKACERKDSEVCEYPDYREVRVRLKDSAVVEDFCVDAESVRQYHATRLPL